MIGELANAFKLDPTLFPAWTTYVFLYIFRTSTDSGGEDSLITVEFHAILSQKFTLDDQTKIVILGDKPVFGGWNDVGIAVRKEK